MYGTVARVRVDPAQIPQLQALSRSMEKADGQLATYVFQMDADPAELYLVAVFASKEDYWANAQSPEQHARYLQMRALFSEDPEWHDGAIIDAD